MASSQTANNPMAHQAWFQGAPISKLLSMVWIAGHVFLKGTKISTITPPGTSMFFFESTGELVMGLLFLIPQLKTLERELSSRQLIVWLAWIASVGFGVECLLRVVSVHENENDDSLQVACCPYLWMGGVLSWYMRYVPRLHPKFVSVLGISLSEKALQCLWGMYVVGNGGTSTIIMALVGAVSSVVYLAVVPRDLLPDGLVSKLPWDSIGGLFLLDPPAPMHVPLMMNHHAGIGMGAGGGGAGGGRGGAAMRPARRTPAAAAAAPRPTAPLEPPSQEAIDQLTAMGFDEDRVRIALQNTNNNLERAADRLVMGN